MHKEAFTRDNAALLLIDHQTGTMAWTHWHDIKTWPSLHPHIPRLHLRVQRCSTTFSPRML